LVAVDGDAPIGNRLPRRERGFGFLRPPHGTLRRRLEADVHFRRALRHLLSTRSAFLDAGPMDPELRRLLARLPIEGTRRSITSGSDALRMVVRPAAMGPPCPVRPHVDVLHAAGALP